jgi:DNA-binding MarR family transcriptional regulator
VEVAADANFLNGYLPYLLRQADQTLSAPFYAVLTRYGVARSEWRVIAVLHEVGELSVADLANEALSPQPTVTHAVRRLEKHGLVTRTRGTTDKRQRFVALSPSGKQLTATLMNEAKELETDLLADAEHLPELVELLLQLTAAVKARTPGQSDEASDVG